MSQVRKSRPKDMRFIRPKDLRSIESIWAGPMANNVTTRVRYSMWDAVRWAANLVDQDAKKTILAALDEDIKLFNRKFQF